MTKVTISSLGHQVDIEHDGADLGYVVEKAQKLFDDTKGAAAFVCTGRPVDDAGQPIGEPCGRTITLGRSTVWDVEGPAAAERRLVDYARAAGWAVSDPRADGGRDVMCPRCRRPDPALVRLTQELTR